MSTPVPPVLRRRVTEATIWDVTQSFIAFAVTTSAMVAGLYVTFYGNAGEQIPTILSVAFGAVVGFYFSRTNGAVHKRDSYRSTDAVTENDR